MAKKTYFHTCPTCGANLDPGETCDCSKQTKATKIVYICDRKACNPCSGEHCHYTTDIRHAVNFKNPPTEADLDRNFVLLSNEQYMEQDRCVCCGRGVPEGRLICPRCEVDAVVG
jgi:hypothetical protein